MLTTATQQRNSQDNLQGNPQSETSPISIETSPITPIIDAARIFSLRFTARMKRISTILIMSVLMVFLSACGGGGGGGDDVTPLREDPISVSNLRVIPDVSSAILMWDNPDAHIQHIEIIYEANAADSFETRRRVTDPSKTARGKKNVTQIISGLTSANYTFNIHLELGGVDESKSVMARERTLLIGPNLDGDEYADADPNEFDIDGDDVNNTMDAFPSDPTESVDTDGDRVGDNADAFPADGTLSAFTVSGLRAIPGDESVNLRWNNPDAVIANISISYKLSTADNFATPITIIDDARLDRNIEVREMIPSLMSDTNYTFSVTLELKGADENKSVIAAEITRLIGPNLDGDEYADTDPLELDIDGDDVNNTMDAFPSDPNESMDMDGDRVGDNADAFPADPTESVDTDGDRVGDNADACDEPGGLTGWTSDGSTDSDGDGCRDSDEDAFPSDPTESVDTDGDRVGDNADAFPSDPTESVDTDGDRVGNNADACDEPGGLTGWTSDGSTDSDGDGCRDSDEDAFPTDPTESVDTDRDGVGDNADAFPEDPTESMDTDRDGVGDNADAFPADPTESVDTDNDGVGDNADAFPNDPTESMDTDGDGIGNNADAFPTDSTLSAFTVSGLRVIPDVSNATLIWDNPDADIAKISISYKLSTAANFGTPIPIMDDARIARNETDVMGMIPVGLLTTPNVNYTFSVTLELGGADENKSVIAAEVTRLIGSNIDGDEYTDADPLEFDIDGDGVNNTMDAFPTDPTESADTDNDGVGDNADACDGLGAAIGWTSDATTDKDGDGCLDSDEDVDTNGNGLIEIATAQELNQTRHNLLGSSFTRSAGGVGDANGCGGMEGVIACNGYELTQNISLADYTDWQPIGGCPTYASASSGCTDTAALFNATFDGKDYIISNLTITNSNGDYANAAGLFGAISSTSILRNIHIRSGNISGGETNVGLLVGYARGESDNIRPSIINSSAEGAVTASGNRVGGLVGDGERATITSSYAAGGAVSGFFDVGGLVGDGERATITSSYAAGGDVSGAQSVGGLVGYGRAATIMSSYAAGGSVSGERNRVGGLVGLGFRAIITSSYAAGGSVSGTGGTVGGLVGDGRISIITSSYAAGGDVSGGDNVGGLVGDGYRAKITSSYAAGGAVSGDDEVGGLVGDGDLATITLSYAAGGDVSGTGLVGGLVGGGDLATITLSYAAGGAVSGTGLVGGLVGGGDLATMTPNSYWDNSVNIMGPSDGGSYGLPKTTNELQAPVHATGIYAMWTSSCPGTNKPAWYFGTSTQYPVLTCHPNSDSDRDGVPDIIDTDDDGDGIDDTADALPLNPTESVDRDNDGVGDNADACDGLGAAIGWTSDATTDKDGDGCRDSDEDVDTNGNGLIEIANAEQLNQSRHNLLGSSFKSSADDAGDANGCGGMEGVIACNGYELIADIYLTTYANWQPIGGCPTYASPRCTDTAALFNAIFDGNNHTINNLTITNPAGSYANASGLFGAISSDSILRNIHIRSGNISGGGNNVGLLVGYARGESVNIGPSIINSSAEGAVNASGNFVGGLVGDGFRSTITSSYAAGGAVSGDFHVGGLVGDGQDARITSSYAAGGAVSGGNFVGGLVGNGNSAEITSSYAAGGSVSGTGNNVGGLVGNGLSATITSSYAAGGAVRGDGGAVGGLVGLGHSATITSSYAAGGDVSGTGIDVGGLVGNGHSATITSSYAAGGNVSGNNNVGGLVGWGFRSTITSSYAAGGDVSGDSNVGGLVGYGDSAEITSSYAAGGDVSGRDFVGGLVGYGWNARITSSYAAGGAVSGTSVDRVGGLVGAIVRDSNSRITITDSYWDREKSGQESSHGGGDAKTTSALQTPTEATGIYSTWAEDTCADGSTLVWDFGTASDYPALNCTPNGLPAQLHLRQR